VRPAAPRSCRETRRPRSSSSREHSSSFFSSNGSLGGGEHRGPADPVPAGGGAEQDQDVARAGRGAAHQPLPRGEPQGHGVDEAVLLVWTLEVHLAADRGDADRVAVVGDPGDGSLEQVASSLIVIGAHLAEAQRVEHGDRACADGEDVAQDAPDARGRPLEGLDGARMVVGLDLEGAYQAASHVDRAGVLAGAHHHVLALRGQCAQELLGVLVGAVLAPQQGVHRQLEDVGCGALLLADELVLRAGEPERDRILDRREGRRLRHGRPRSQGAWTRRSSDRRPSRRRAPRRHARDGASARTRSRRRCARRRCREPSR
jgi:hypothetical protein